MPRRRRRWSRKDVSSAGSCAAKTSGPRAALRNSCASGTTQGCANVPAPRSVRGRLVALFVVLLGAFALGIWGTILRPPAYEVRGEVIARPAPNLLVVRHDAVAGLGMAPMELMALSGDSALIDGSGARPGDRVRLAVRPRNDEVVLLRIDVLR